VPAGAEPERFELRLGHLLAHLAAGERVLDLGCGEGAFAGELAANGARVTGADVAQEPLRRARSRHPQLEFVHVGGELPFAQEEFDLVWLGEVLEHVQDCLGLLGEVRRVLRPGGQLVCSTPDHGPLRRAAFALSARAFERHFDPRSDHVRFFTARSLDSLLADGGLRERRIRARSGILLGSARR
jgi:2-polyprenyl-3-methyl-5-hydroxy-6-metoxy-1,4-benzoquinol methylase